ncbi:hypothetical protein Tco_1556250 [Tanacetum coccineum]
MFPRFLRIMSSNQGKYLLLCFNLFGIAPPTLSLFPNDPYMKALQAFYTEKSPIPPPIIIPPKLKIFPARRTSFQPTKITFFLPVPTQNFGDWRKLSKVNIERHKENIRNASKKASTTEAPAMTQVALDKEPRSLLVNLYERETKKSSLAGQPCAEENKVTFATGTLTDDALSWWNAYAQPMGIEQANQITWTELKRLLTNKYCPGLRSEDGRRTLQSDCKGK